MNPLTHRSWARWLDRVEIWADQERLIDKVWLDEEQRAAIAGWTIGPPGAS